MYITITAFLTTVLTITLRFYLFISESEGLVSSSSFIKGLDFGHGRVCSQWVKLENLFWSTYQSPGAQFFRYSTKNLVILLFELENFSDFIGFRSSCNQPINNSLACNWNEKLDCFVFNRKRWFRKLSVFNYLILRWNHIS